MAKPKMQTHQQKLGFFDEDLKKTEHDEIVKWVELNMESLICELISRSDQKLFSELVKIFNTNKEHVNFDWKKEFEIIEKEWEPIILTNTNNKYPVGYVDYYCKVRLQDSNYYRFQSHNTESKLEYNPNDRNFGLELMDSLHPFEFYFEVKTKINTLGELFRQLRLYQTYIGGSTGGRNVKLCVVCPDDIDASIIEEQGFPFIKYK